MNIYGGDTDNKVNIFTVKLGILDTPATILADYINTEVLSTEDRTLNSVPR